MAQATSEGIPREVRGFEQHGVVFSALAGEEHVVGRCPFCDSEGHFYVNAKTLAWDCKRCQEKGSYHQFLELVSERNCKRMTGEPLASLARDRGLRKKTLQRWGVGWDGKQYTIPIIVGGRFADLRRYTSKHGSHITAQCKAGLLKADDLQSRSRMKDPVWICEGEWDAMAWWQVLRATKRPGIVVATPGASVFKAEWAGAFRGRRVFVLFDNDDAGIRGSRRIYDALNGIARKLHFLHWGERRPSGFDIRDLYQEGGRKAILTYTTVADMLEEQPPEDASTLSQKQATSPDLEEDLTGEGLGAEEVIVGYREWLHLPDATVLDVLFGVLFANRLLGDPVWMFIVAPGGGTKSELLMSLSGSPLIFTTSSLTPHALISGASTIGAGDPSLISRLDGKVLVVKDFSPLMTMNQTARDEIFSVLRDAYDQVAEKSFGHGLTKSYNSRFGLIAGVTPAIDMVGAVQASLGERFLKYRIRHDIRRKSMRELLKRAQGHIIKTGDIRSELQAVAEEVLNRDIDLGDIPRLMEEESEYLITLAQWVAALRSTVIRSRYTGDVAYTPYQEIGTRLVKELTKLAIGIAIFRQADSVNEHACEIVTQVGVDTVPDRVVNVVKQLFLRYEKGLFFSPTEISDMTGLPEGTPTEHLLENLMMLKVLQRKRVGRFNSRWKLRERIVRLTTPLHLFTQGRMWGKGS